MLELCDTHDTSIPIGDTYVYWQCHNISRYIVAVKNIVRWHNSRASMLPYSFYHSTMSACCTHSQSKHYTIHSSLTTGLVITVHTSTHILLIATLW